jgi:hypothetical protein
MHHVPETGAWRHPQERRYRFYIVDNGDRRKVKRHIVVPMGWESWPAANAELADWLSIYPPDDDYRVRYRVEALDPKSRFVQEAMSLGERAGKNRRGRCRIPMRESKSVAMNRQEAAP